MKWRGRQASVPCWWTSISR